MLTRKSVNHKLNISYIWLGYTFKRRVQKQITFYIYIIIRCLTRKSVNNKTNINYKWLAYTFKRMYQKTNHLLYIHYNKMLT